MTATKKTQNFRLNPNALLVKGTSRSLICDLERRKYRVIPNSLYELLTENKSGTLEKLIERYAEGSAEVAQIIEEYFEMLIGADLIFFTDFPDFYQDLSLQWDFSSFITNAILDFDNQSFEHYYLFIPQILKQHTRFLQLRFYCTVSIETISEMMDFIETDIIEGVELVAPYNSSIDNEVWFQLLKKYPRIIYVQLYNAEAYATFGDEEVKSRGKLMTVKNPLSSETHCGVIAPHYFSVNIPTFTESQHHNTCLNRKISIDKDGYIKNCPSMKHHFGHISEVKLEEVIRNPEFTKYWHIKKDEISKCRDCEFRHICTDCRAYLENPEDLYSAPLKCGYDPYTNVWEEWSTNPLKEAAIQHYELNVKN